MNTRKPSVKIKTAKKVLSEIKAHAEELMNEGIDISVFEKIDHYILQSEKIKKEIEEHKTSVLKKTVQLNDVRDNLSDLVTRMKKTLKKDIKSKKKDLNQKKVESRA